MTTRLLFNVSAAVEALTGIAMLIAPAHVTGLLLGDGLSQTGTAVTRVLEIGLLARNFLTSRIQDELKRAISEQPPLGSDELTLINNGKKHWISCMTVPLFASYHTVIPIGLAGDITVRIAGPPGPR